MRFALAILVVALCSTGARADVAINTLIGDASWAGHDQPGDEVERVRAHLGFVHAMLAARDVSALPQSVQHARAASLEDLAHYIARGEFPQRTADGYAGRRPRFIDDRGVHCAVGELIKASGAPDLARAINVRFEYAHVRDMEEPALVAWANAHGFTVDELALIQPGYSALPTASSTRKALIAAKDAIALRCARKHPPMKSLLVYAIGKRDGSVEVYTKSSDPFARCFAREASHVQTGGGAYIGSPKPYTVGIDLSFTPPQKLLDRLLASWEPRSCVPRPGPLARTATLSVTSTAKALEVHASTVPVNESVARCLEDEMRTGFSEFGAGAWKLHGTRQLALQPRVVVAADQLRYYAMNSAIECAPEPAPGATSAITVVAKVDDPHFTITATGAPEFAACMSASLGTQLESNYRANYAATDDPKAAWVPYFRIDADVNVSLTITLESKAARDKRNEELQKKMEQERNNDRYGF